MAQCIYIYSDKNGAVLNVGRTGRGRRRQAEHLATKVWWPATATITIIHTPDERVTSCMESLLIHYYRPRYNTRREKGDYVVAAQHLSDSGQLERLPRRENLEDWIWDVYGKQRLADLDRWFEQELRLAGLTQPEVTGGIQGATPEPEDATYASA